MNAADTIRAAIERLERQRDAASESAYGAWEITPPSRPGEHAWLPALSIAVVTSAWDACIEPAAAELIVTLHRTIDAQLVILREGEKTLTELESIGFGGGVLGRAESAWRLARAILGEDIE